MRPAKPDDFTGHEDQLAAEHIVGGEAIFQAMHAAGILRDIAADRAGDLGGGIGGVVKALRLDRAGDREIGDTRFDDRETVGEVDLLDFVELHHRDEHAVLERQGAPRERGSSAPRHHLHIVFVAIGEQLLDLRDGFRQDDHHRQGTVGGQAVAFIGAAARLRFDNPFAGRISRKAATIFARRARMVLSVSIGFILADLSVSPFSGRRTRKRSFYDKTPLAGERPTSLLSSAGRPISASIPHEDRATLLQGPLPVASRSLPERAVHNDPRRP